MAQFLLGFHNSTPSEDRADGLMVLSIIIILISEKSLITKVAGKVNCKESVKRKRGEVEDICPCKGVRSYLNSLFVNDTDDLLTFRIDDKAGTEQYLLKG